MSNPVYKKITYLDNVAEGNVFSIGYLAGTLSEFDISYVLPEIPSKFSSKNNCAYLFRCVSGISGMGFYPLRTNPYAQLHIGSYYGYASQGSTNDWYRHTSTANTLYRAVVNPSKRYIYRGGSLLHSGEGKSFDTLKADGILYGNSGNFIHAHVYELKISIDNTLVRNLIPMKRIEDGICGLFDLVSKVFYAGSEVFTGPEEEVYYTATGAITRESTLEEKLINIEETKTLIKNALINKGQEITDTDTFRSYVEKIDALKIGELTLDEYNSYLNTTDNILGYKTSNWIRPVIYSYIDTGINPYGKTLRYEFKFGPITGLVDSDYALFGGFNSSQGLNLGTLYSPANTVSGIDRSWHLYGKTGNPLATNITKRHAMAFTNDTVEGFIEIGDLYSYKLHYLSPGNSEDLIFEGSGDAPGDFPTDVTITLFGQNSENGIAENSVTRPMIYYFKIYLDGIKVRDFQPCDENGVLCLFDKVSKTYFHAINGSFDERG